MKHPCQSPSIYTGAASDFEQSHRESSRRYSPRTRSSSMGRSTSSKNRQQQRSRSQPPFQIALNLLMKVQPLDGEYSVEPLEVSLGGQNVYSKKGASTIHRASDALQTRRFETSRTFPDDPNYCSAYDYSESEAEEVSRPRKSSMKKKRTRPSSIKQRRPTPAKSIQSRYKNKKSLLDFSKMKPLSSNLPIPKSWTEPRPPRTSEVAFATVDKPAVADPDRRVSAHADITRYFSPGTSKHPKGYTRFEGDDVCPPRKLTFSECVQEIEASSTSEAESSTKSVDVFSTRYPSPRTPQYQSHMSDRGFSANTSAEKKARPQFSQPQSLALEQAPRNDQLRPVRTLSNSSVELPPSEFLTTYDNPPVLPSQSHPMNFSPGCDDVFDNESVRSISFSEVSPDKRASCDIHISLPDSNLIPHLFYHKRRLRLGFIANSVQIAFNVDVNIRSGEEDLFLEPVELQFEDQKVWRRSARAVTKEIELQRANKAALRALTNPDPVATCPTVSPVPSEVPATISIEKELPPVRTSYYPCKKMLTSSAPASTIRTAKSPGDSCKKNLPGVQESNTELTSSKK